MKYLLLLDKDYFYYYLFMHPEVMEDQTIRKRVLNNYLLNNQFRRETRDYYHDRYSPTFVNNLRRLTYDNTYYNFNKYNRSHNQHTNVNINLNQDQLKRDIWQELQERYQQIHEENIREIEEKPPNEEEPLPTDNTSDTQQKIDDILKKHREQMDKRHRKVQKDAENRVKVLTERMNVKNGSRFKRWLSSHAHNTRHDCNDLQIVPIDKKFIIVNDKTGQMDMLDYPGDPTGSPANVYNCLCDVDFDADILKDGINLDEYDYQQVKKEQTQKSEEIKISEKIKKVLTKNKTHRSIKNINKYVTQKQINNVYERIKEEFPPEFSELAIKEIIKMQIGFAKDANEHGCVINISSGEIFNPRDGENNRVTLSYSGIDDMKNLASIHNHPSHGFNAPSDTDIENMLKNKNEKYCVVMSDTKIWIVKNKYLNVDLSKKENTKKVVDCLNIVSDVRGTLTQNKISELDDVNALESINNKVDKEVYNVFEKNDVYSKIVKI